MPFPVPVWVPGPIVALVTLVRVSVPVMPAIFIQGAVMPSSSVISPSVAPAASVVVFTMHGSASCAASTADDTPFFKVPRLGSRIEAVLGVMHLLNLEHVSIDCNLLLTLYCKD